MDHLTPREAWRKSSYSSASSDNCVEVAAAARTIAVRDSKDPAWSASGCSGRFLGGVHPARPAVRRQLITAPTRGHRRPAVPLLLYSSFAETGSELHAAGQAPSMTRFVPETKDTAWLATKTAARAISSGLAIRPVGFSPMAWANNSGLCCSMFSQTPPGK